MRLMRDDSMVLAQLVETLGTIVVCAHEKPDLTAMVEQLLLFFATLRSHRDVVVRRAVLQHTLLFVSPSCILHLTQEMISQANIAACGKQNRGTPEHPTGDGTA